MVSSLRSRGCGSEPEPARSPGCAELDLADQPVAELGVADAPPSVRRRWLPTGDRRRDVVRYNACGRLGEDAGLGDGTRAGADVTNGVDVFELGPEVGLIDGHPAVDREARRREGIWRP